MTKLKPGDSVRIFGRSGIADRTNAKVVTPMNTYGYHEVRLSDNFTMNVHADNLVPTGPASE
jgi:hypothetical protein